jgi:integrase
LLTHVRGRLTDEAHVERSLNRFAASWPGKKIADIQVDDVEAWARARLMTEHRGKPIKGATVNRDLAHLSAFFTWAINHRLAADNPASPRRVKLYPEPWRAYQSLTAPQIAQVLDLAPDPEERAKVALLALTGQRRGVIVDMTWQQVDLSGRMLTYRSKRLDRSIPLSDQVIGILRSLGPRPDGYVFRNRSKDHTRRWWVQATRAIGMPNLRLHDLRVTFARLLADQGEDLITIMACMGHSKVTTTQRYIPIYRGQVQGAMGKMGAMIDLSVGGLSRRGDRAQGPEAHDNDDLVGDL